MSRALVALAVAALGAVAPGCSLGEGQGDVKSDRLVVNECWDGAFSLAPDFFAAVPYRDTVTIRVQHGGDIEEVSDGMTVLVDSIEWVRAHLDQPIDVGLPVGVTPPGVPVTYQADPPRVHLSLYLHRGCHAQNVTLYSISGHVTFHALFDGDPNETVAAEKLTFAEFSDIVVADPRDLDPSSDTPKVLADRSSTIYGGFRFYFQRGQPGQPFP